MIGIATSTSQGTAKGEHPVPKREAPQFRRIKAQ